MSGISERVGHLYVMISILSIPIFATILTYIFISDTIMDLFVKTISIITYLFILLNKKCFCILKERFYTLSPKIIRMVLSGLVLLCVAISDNVHSDETHYYLSAFAILLGVVLIGLGKIGAILGLR